MLTGTGFCNNALLTHTVRQQCLTNGVVDLVGTGVVKVFALQINLGTTENLTPTLGVINRARTANEMLQLTLEFSNELRIAAVMRISML